jgi:hypothetical protein
MAAVLIGMNARIVTTATLLTAIAGVLTARAADSQLLGLVMPDAKLLAGVNVDQAKASPFGLYVLTQMQSGNSGMKELIALTGFDPTRDVHELLAASNGTPGGQTPMGLLLTRGNFEPATITALATGKGAATEVYAGVTIIEDPKQTAGVAFLDPTLAVVGDLANVKAAIDRPGTGQSLPSAVIAQVNQWSGSEDAWIIVTVPPSSLAPAAAAPQTGANGAAGALQGIFQQIQQAAGGVKFGNSVVGAAALQVDTAQNATQMANALQFLVNMAQMQSQNSPQVAALAQGLAISAQGATVKISLTLPQAQFQQFIQQHKRAVMGPARANPVRSGVRQ